MQEVRLNTLSHRLVNLEAKQRLCRQEHNEREVDLDKEDVGPSRQILWPFQRYVVEVWQGLFGIALPQQVLLLKPPPRRVQFSDILLNKAAF